jgi:biotin carboxyl carrier protein
MKFSLMINGNEHTLEMNSGKVVSCRLDGAAFEAEAAEVRPGVYSLLIGGKSFSVRVAPNPESAERAPGESSDCRVRLDGETYFISIRDPRRWSRSRSTLGRGGPRQITAPMPGKVIRILVTEGQQIEAGQGLIVVEAMKMQNEIKSQAAGTVQKVVAREGQPVTAGETLLIIE